MDKNIQEILSRSLYSQGADLLTQRTLNEIFNLNRNFEPTVEWRDQVIVVCDMMHKLGQGLSVIQAVVLAIIEDHWEEFDQDFRDMYQDDFLIFAYKKYRRNPKTIRGDLRAVRVFLLADKIAKPFGVIEIPKRNIVGEVQTDERGKIITEEVEWNPLKSDLAKLKAAVPLVEQGKLDKSTWAMMMDDKVSSSQMIQKVYEISDCDPHPPQLGIRFRLEGPVLVAYENWDIEIELGELDWAGYYEEPYSLKHRALDKLMQLLGLTLDEHITLYREADANNGYYSND